MELLLRIEEQRAEKEKKLRAGCHWRFAPVATVRVAVD